MTTISEHKETLREAVGETPFMLEFSGDWGDLFFTWNLPHSDSSGIHVYSFTGNGDDDENDIASLLPGDKEALEWAVGIDGDFEQFPIGATELPGFIAHLIEAQRILTIMKQISPWEVRVALDDDEDFQP